MWFVVYTLPSVYYCYRLIECQLLKYIYLCECATSVLVAFSFLLKGCDIVRSYCPSSRSMKWNHTLDFLLRLPTRLLCSMLSLLGGRFTSYEDYLHTDCTRLLSGLLTLTGKPWIAVRLYFSLYHLLLALPKPNGGINGFTSRFYPSFPKAWNKLSVVSSLYTDIVGISCAYNYLRNLLFYLCRCDAILKILYFR